MGGRGSGGRPKLTALKRLHRSGEPINEHEPLPEGDLTATVDTAPAHFDDDQRAAWHYALEHAPPGLLKLLDASVLECWVVAHCTHRRAVSAMNADGELIVTTPNGCLMPSPYIAIIKGQALILMRAAAELGFSPSARPRISVTLGGRELNGSTNAPASDEESLDEYLARAPDPKAIN